MSLIGDDRFPDAAAVPAWHLVARSSELRRGQALARNLLGNEIALFRTQSGIAHALSAHCSHAGTHLAYGKVVGEHLRCPMHHWEYDGAGICRQIPARHAIPERACQQSYPLVEQLGGLFLYQSPTSREPECEPPGFSVPEAELCVGHGRTVRLRCPWYAVAANAYDMRHLLTVHDRALVEPPEVETLPGRRLRLRYVSRVTGRGLTDTTMRLLANNRIQVVITCWSGTALVVEANLGRVRSALLLGLLPTEWGTEVKPVFAIRRAGPPGWDALRVALARWLYFGFLSRDVRLMDGMRFRPRLVLPEDAVLHEFVEWARGLGATTAPPLTPLLPPARQAEP